MLAPKLTQKKTLIESENLMAMRGNGVISWTENTRVETKTGTGNLVGKRKLMMNAAMLESEKAKTETEKRTGRTVDDPTLRATGTRKSVVSASARNEKVGAKQRITRTELLTKFP